GPGYNDNPEEETHRDQSVLVDLPWHFRERHAGQHGRKHRSRCGQVRRPTVEVPLWAGSAGEQAAHALLADDPHDHEESQPQGQDEAADDYVARPQMLRLRSGCDLHAFCDRRVAASYDELTLNLLLQFVDA